jgi:serine protease Do
VSPRTKRHIDNLHDTFSEDRIMSRRHPRTWQWGLVGLAALSVACGGKLDAGKCDDEQAAAPAATATADAAPRAAIPRLNTTPPIPAVSDLEHAFERASEAIAPSVVAISSVRKLDRAQRALVPFGLGGDGDPLRELFRLPQPRGELRQQGLGSIVIVSADGYVLTNNHVVDDADEIEVVLHDDRKLKGEVVGTDPHTDLAVIKVDAANLVPASLGDSDVIKVGQWVLAAGNPFGLSRTISAGIVSAVGRSNMGITDYEQFIQTDAAINPGNSGGPLIDLQGRVLGVNTAIASRGGGSNGVGFAVPVNMARRVMEQIITGGKVVRGWLGLMIGPLTPELAKSFGYTDTGGILVQDVVADGPAKQAGLQSGDIVLERDGKPVKDATAFRNEIAQAAPGTRVSLKIWRARAVRTLEVVLGELPDPDGAAGKAASPTAGLALRDPSDALRQRFDLEVDRGAVVLDVEPGSPAEAAGLRPGDVIEQIGDVPVHTAAEASKQLSAAALEKGVRLRVRRGKYGHFMILRGSK